MSSSQDSYAVGKATQMLTMIGGIIQILLLCLLNPVRALLIQEQNKICYVLFGKKEAWEVINDPLFLSFWPVHFLSSSL